MKHVFSHGSVELRLQLDIGNFSTNVLVDLLNGYGPTLEPNDYMGVGQTALKKYIDEGKEVMTFRSKQRLTFWNSITRT